MFFDHKSDAVLGQCFICGCAAMQVRCHTAIMEKEIEHWTARWTVLNVILLDTGWNLAQEVHSLGASFKTCNCTIYILATVILFGNRQVKSMELCWASSFLFLILKHIFNWIHLKLVYYDKWTFYDALPVFQCMQTVTHFKLCKISLYVVLFRASKLSMEHFLTSLGHGWTIVSVHTTHWEYCKHLQHSRTMAVSQAPPLDEK